MELISIISTTVIALGTFAVGLFAGKRIKIAEAREKEAIAAAAELNNVSSEVRIYKEMLDDLKTHNDEMRKINQDLMATVQPLRDRVTHLEASVHKLEVENAELKKLKK